MGLNQEDADQLMSAHLKADNLALGVASLRNSRAITCDMRLDGKILSLNLLRSELISTFLANPFMFQLGL